MPLIHGEQKEREHDDNHAERGGAVAGRASEQKEKRYSDECRRSETYKLPFGKPKQHFGFYFRQILWNGYIRQFITSKRKEDAVAPSNSIMQLLFCIHEIHSKYQLEFADFLVPTPTVAFLPFSECLTLLQ